MITKARRESFGGILFSENPGFTAFINEEYADKLQIPQSEHLPQGFYSAPLDVHISLTTRCNLHCRGCYTAAEGESGKDIDLSMAKSIVDSLSRLNVFTIAFGGGEPFLYPHIFELAGYIRRKQIVPNVTTNGTLLDEETAERCRVFGTLHLSVHHLSELPRLGEAIRHLEKAEIHPGINLLLTRENVEHLEQVYSWAAGHKITRILFLRFKVISRNRDCGEMGMTEEQETNLFPRLKKLSRRHHIVPMVDCSLFPALAIHGVPKKHLQYQDVNGCLGGNAFLAVDVDGNYRPCSFWPDAFGAAANLTRREWVQNGVLQRFRRRRSGVGCSNCGYLDLCNGGCRLEGKRACVEAHSSGTPRSPRVA